MPDAARLVEQSAAAEPAGHPDADRQPRQNAPCRSRGPARRHGAAFHRRRARYASIPGRDRHVVRRLHPALETTERSSVRPGSRFARKKRRLVARKRAEPLDSGIYDAALEQRVIEFQRDHRLDVDGLAGQQTQIIINSLLGSEDTPRLTAPTPRLARE